MKRKYIIWVPPFDENIGGIIVLHMLCDLLNSLGEQAYIWPESKPVFKLGTPFSSIVKILKYSIKQVHNSYPVFLSSKLTMFRIMSRKLSYKFELSECFNTPIAGYRDLHGSIVIYPEIVSGNPLGLKRVVRWLLNRPGFFTGEISYGEDELLFYFQKAFDDPDLNKDPDNLLRIVWIRDDVYYQRNHSPRNGTCYMQRKGHDRVIQHDLADCTLIDGLSHEEISKIFNECKYFISYDLYTMYSIYAAVCGCISIVVPMDGLSKEAWRPESERRYGIAYGADDVEFAARTRYLLFNELDNQKTESLKMVEKFIVKTKNKYM